MQAIFRLAAIAAACASVSALADTTIYGKVNLSLEHVAAKGAGNGQDIAPMQRVTSNLSYIGFKGEENLGNGLKAVWQVEQDINPDNCSGSCGGFANRNSFVGLKGDWGRMIAGRYDMYWTSHIAGMDSRIIGAGLAGSILSVFGTFGGYNPTPGNSRRATAALMGGRAVNVLRYDTPNLDGWSGSLSYATGEVRGASGSPSAWQVESDYKKGPLVANLAYLHANDSNGSLTNTSGAAYDGMRTDAAKLVAAWRFDQGTLIGLGAEYLATRYPEGGKVRRMAYAAHLGQSLSPAAYVGMSLGRAGKIHSSLAGSASTEDSDARFISLIASYHLSKRTMVYAEYARLFNAANAGYYFVSTGNLNNASAGLVAGKGADPRSLMIGMNHVF
ncbi:MAG: hypothetical protein RI925_665 [Pseudomonadota bacterium]|jgi:predicted porin